MDYKAYPTNLIKRERRGSPYKWIVRNAGIKKSISILSKYNIYKKRT